MIRDFEYSVGKLNLCFFCRRASVILRNQGIRFLPAVWFLIVWSTSVCIPNKWLWSTSLLRCNQHLAVPEYIYWFIRDARTIRFVVVRHMQLNALPLAINQKAELLRSTFTPKQIESIYYTYPTSAAHWVFYLEIFTGRALRCGKTSVWLE